MNQPMFAQPEYKPELTLKERWAKGLFWGWNIIFLAFMILGFAPRLLPDLVTAVQMQAIAGEYLLYALALTLIPVLAVILGYFVLRREPLKLFALGYVVEGPAMLILALRFFLVRQGSTGLVCLLIAAGLGMLAFLWHLLDRHIEQRGAWAGWLRLSGLTLMLLVALYAAVWIGFYALPGVFLLFEVIGEAVGGWRGMPQNPLWIPFSLLGFVLMVFTTNLFLLAPAAVPLLAYRAWRRALDLWIQKGQAQTAAGLVFAVILAAGVAFVWSNRQPQIDAFAQLEHAPQSVDAARRLMSNETALRRGLLNAYLAPFRYISAQGEVTHIADLYRDNLGFSRSAAAVVQAGYEQIARPVLYHPAHSLSEYGNSLSGAERYAMQREPAQAARLYQRVFDETIVEGERRQIVAAGRSTWMTESARATLERVAETEIHLDRQDLTITEHGDWAEIELHEVYRNTTGDRQEVIAYFSLPETAVITGVWLGDSPEREIAHTFIVAPRGAAQGTYRNEVRRSMDPALVEQIGPRQYRLRVFPIPALEMVWNDASDRWQAGDAAEVHLWLTWKTLASAGAWPLPQLAYGRNLFWDAGTLRTINGSETPAMQDERGEDRWLPETVPASAPVMPAAHRIDLPGGYTILAEPRSPETAAALPAGTRLAVVIDRSRSMERLSAQVEQAVAHLRDLPGVQTDAYLTAASFRGEPPEKLPLSEVDAQKLVFLGGQNPGELLAQFANLSAGEQYDVVIVLSDASGYELGENERGIPVPAMPVWFVHLGQSLPLGYDDSTLAALQGSRGGVAANLEAALERIAAGMESAELNREGPLVTRDIVDGYVWQTLPTADAPGAQSGDAGFAALAARRAILAEIQRNAGKLDDLATLDQLHVWAQQYGIVTPYSSMIVLVDQEQERLLRQLSQANDRFDREVENLGNTQPATATPLVGVPEPEEWLLIAVALALLGYAVYTRRS